METTQFAADRLTVDQVKHMRGVEAKKYDALSSLTRWLLLLLPFIQPSEKPVSISVLPLQ